jgi:hypothetical protein
MSSYLVRPVPGFKRYRCKCRHVSHCREECRGTMESTEDATDDRRSTL